MAHATSKAPRRAILGRGAAGLLVGAAVALAGRADAAAASVAGDGDAELIALVNVMASSREALELMEKEPLYDFGSPEQDASERQVGMALDAFWGAAKRVVGMTAVTPAGWGAKAEAMRLTLLQCVCTNEGETLDDIAEHEFEHRMAWSLARDILAMGGVA